MNIIRTIFLSAAVLVLFSCEDPLKTRPVEDDAPQVSEPVPSDLREFQVSGLTFNAGDAFSVFDCSPDQNKYEYKADGLLSPAEGETPKDRVFRGVYAVYPYSESISMQTPGTSILMNIPAEVNYGEAPAAAGRIKGSASVDLQMKPVLGSVRLDIYGYEKKIKTLNLYGNNNETLAGEAVLNIASDGATSLEFTGTDATKTLTVRFGAEGLQPGADAEHPVSVYVNVPEMTFANGFTVELIDVSNTVFKTVKKVSISVSEATIPVQKIHPPLKVTVVGDSYSTYQGWNNIHDSSFAVYYPQSGIDVTAVDHTWWYQITSSGSYSLERNNSYSGSTVSYNCYNTTLPEGSKKAFVNRTTSADMGNPDIILIFGGTNDAWTKTTLQGDYKYADWTYEDLWYFRPAFACLVGRIKANFPNARIINIMNNGRNGKDDAEKGLTLAVAESMTEICRHYGIENIELANVSKVKEHPDKAGMASIYRQVWAVLER